MLHVGKLFSLRCSFFEQTRICLSSQPSWRLLLLRFRHARALTVIRQLKKSYIWGINNRRVSAVEAPPHLLSFLRSGSTRANFINMLWLPPRRDRLLHYVVLVKPLRRCQRGVPLSMSTRAAGHRDLDQATIHCLCFSFLSAAGAAADSGRHYSLPPVSDFLPLLGVLGWRRRQTTGRDMKSSEKAIKY